MSRKRSSQSGISRKNLAISPAVWAGLCKILQIRRPYNDRNMFPAVAQAEKRQGSDRILPASAGRAAPVMSAAEALHKIRMFPIGWGDSKRE